MKKKKCCRCKTEYPATTEYFYISNSQKSKDGLDLSCIVCIKIKNKEYRSRYYEKVRNKERKYYKEHIDEIKRKRSLFKYKAKQKEWRQNHLKEISDYNKKYLREHRLEINKKNSKYCKLNRNKIRIYIKNKLKIDPVFKIIRSLRSTLSKALKRGGATKSERSMNLLGCSSDQLKLHIESKFLYGMTWDNYGNKGWHLDHIRPCASFDLMVPSQQKECFH